MTSITAITPHALDVTGLVRLVEGPGHGAVVAFLGLVRDHNVGRRVTHLVYEAYDALALKALDLIIRESAAQWTSVRMAIHHRTGRLDIGEASVAIVTASAHRADAYAANRYAIERIKQIVPIWKHEYFDGGDAWVEGATADPDNAEARAQAMRVACA
jgi:molybdopterin synthase catalytic subunit